MIREYRVSDREELLDVFKLNIPKYFDPKEVDDFLEYLDDHGDTYLTIEKDNKIVGGVGYIFNDSDKSGQITWIFLHPEYTDHGLGKQAVEHCITLLKSNSEIVKLVVTTSQLAFRFFEKFGFNLIRTEKDYWGSGLDLFLMEIQLNDEIQN
ncbi:MAG: GNAT family N-acetyltransferase [Bacteroidales bacterium]|jgi:ribosomal protein S18 acetylase RimI-like enzyme|nr:GNAT family N-acetyltransferase [Bacteroidales bacterium]